MKAKRILKKIRNIILITLLSVFLLLIVLTTIVLNSENTITQLALDEVSTMIDAPVSVDNVKLRLFMNFPFATVEFSGFTVGKQISKSDSIGNEQLADTLVRFRKFYVSLKTMPLLDNNIEIEKVELEGFKLNYLVDTAGVSNFDFLLALNTLSEADSLPVTDSIPTDTSETALNILLANLTISDVVLFYSDQKLKAAAKIHIPEMHVNAKVLKENITAAIKGGITLTDCHFDETNAHLMQKTAVRFDVGYENGKVNLKSLMLDTDGASIAANGRVEMGDSIFLDMGVNFANIDIKELTKYAPAQTLKEFGVLGLEGKIDVKTKISGYVYDTLLLPKVEAQISMKNGLVRTSDYPIIQEIVLDGLVTVVDPNDLRTVSADFKTIDFATKESSFSIACKVSNIEKPIYNLKAKAVLNLEEFSSFIPDSTVEHLSGMVTLSMSTHGELPNDLGINSADYFLSRTMLDMKVRRLSTALDSVNVIKNLSLNFNYKPIKTMSLAIISLDAPEYKVAMRPSYLLLEIVGNVADIDNLSIKVDGFNFVFGESSLSGKATVKGLTKPEFTFETNTKIDLDEFKHLIPDSIVEHISGKFDLKLSSYGTVNLDSIDAYINPIVFEQSKLKMNVQDFNFEMFNDTLVKVNDLNMDFAMADDTMRIDNFHATMHGIDAWIDSTEIWNVYKTFLLEQKDKKLIMKTHIKLSDFDYNKFAHLIETDTLPYDSLALASVNADSLANIPETSQNGATEPISESKNRVSAAPEKTEHEEIEPDNTDTVATETYIPQFIVNGTVGVKSVKYGNMVMNNISTKFRVDDSLYVLDKFKFEGFGGDMTSSVVYDMRQDSITTVMFKNEINTLDIHQLLVDANNFDHTDFTHENVSGVLTSKLDGRIVMQGDSILFDKIITKGSFKLENGAIYNYEPIKEVGKFTNLRELDNIVFQTMESGVFIYKNNIFFPKTDIVSTAIDVSAFGMASFGDEYEYHLKVHLSDVMIGKSDKLLKQQAKESDLSDEKDPKERKGLNLLSMNRKGVKANGFDNKRAQKVMTAEIRVQERGLSLLFHPKLTNYSTELDRKESKKPKEEKSDE